MKQVKQIDVWMQIILIVAGTVFSCTVKGEYVILPYFIVGGWQLLSMIFHDLNHWFVAKHSKRRKYHNIAYVTVLLMLLCFIIPAFFFIFWVLLFTAPFIAIYSTSLCYTETYQYLKRPLSQLK